MSWAVQVQVIAVPRQSCRSAADVSRGGVSSSGLALRRMWRGLQLGVGAEASRGGVSSSGSVLRCLWRGVQLGVGAEGGAEAV